MRSRLAENACRSRNEHVQMEPLSLQRGTKARVWWDNYCHQKLLVWVFFLISILVIVNCTKLQMYVLKVSYEGTPLS